MGTRRGEKENRTADEENKKCNAAYNTCWSVFFSSTLDLNKLKW